MLYPAELPVLVCDFNSLGWTTVLYLGLPWHWVVASTERATLLRAIHHQGQYTTRPWGRHGRGGYIRKSRREPDEVLVGCTVGIAPGLGPPFRGSGHADELRGFSEERHALRLEAKRGEEIVDAIVWQGLVN